MSSDTSEKAKYAAHGTFIKKINENFLGKWNKPKNALINPIPSTIARQKPKNQQQQQMNVNSKTFNAKFKFQQPIVQKPLNQNLIQPFLYIEKVFKKRKVDQMYDKDAKGKKIKQKPFITSSVSQSNKKNQSQRVGSTAPMGYSNLHQYETDKTKTANLIFQKMLESGIENVKDLFNLWNKNPKRNLTQDINIKQEQFIDFVKEMIPKKVTTATIKHFFKLYKNKQVQKQLPQKPPKPGTQTPIQQIHSQPNRSAEISIRAFSYNYSKYKKSQTEIVNIMSQKAARDRYADLKKYIMDFLQYYPELKIGMKGMKQYEETLRAHFKRLYDGYKNPFQQEIAELKAELEKPIIKYDKQKRERTQKKIEQYQNQNYKIHTKLTQDYTHFMQAYEQAIVKNHDLLFTKRTVVYLLLPIIQREPVLTRDLIEQQVGVRQQEKQAYLQCLSDLIVEIDNDKKHLREDCFTLGEIAEIIKMRFRNSKDQNKEQFMVDSVKKLLKEVKRQFLVKFNLVANDLDNFPADQQIPLEIIHTCFQMQCTKVLFKNKIWNQLLQMLPERTIQSRLHQRSIDANTCMQYLRKYFNKLDERMNIQRNKSKEISLLVENAYNQNFGRYAKLIEKIINSLDFFVDGIEEDQEETKNNKSKKKVEFGDVVDSHLAVQRGEKSLLTVDPKDDDTQIIKNIVKLIHHGAQGVDNQAFEIEKEYKNYKSKVHEGKNIQQYPQRHQQAPTAYENLQMLKSMARSYFQPEAMNTNAFDIRFYQKMADQQNKNKMPSEQLIELGSSMILSGAPRPQEIEGQKSDPLRISRFLLKTIDNQVKQHQKVIHNKQYDRDIYEGVSNNYYKQKIKLQNRPTRYDSQGKSKYSVLLPVGYYQSYIVGQNVPDQQKWYLRPHHVQTLTQNPLSKKDNVIHTEYQSKLEKLGLKKRPDQFVIEQNVKRKQHLIQELEERILALKGQLNDAKRKDEIQGQKVNSKLIDNYYSKITEGKEDKQLQLAAYQGVLYDLRRKQRSLLNKYRSNQTKQYGEPNQKWWERKDKQFNKQVRKDRTLVSDTSGVHKSYVQKLKNNEVY